MSFHLHAQEQDLDDVASLIFDPPVDSPRPLALSPHRQPLAASAPEPAEDEPEHDGTFFFYSGN